MCGVFASIGLPADPTRLDVVAYRGPNDRGWEEFQCPAGPVCLGHRRLSIIDTSSGGHQPMAHPASRCTIVFNGEIYNYRELRGELEALGETFASSSDTEVLLRAWVVWGRDALPRLRGMFAFILWDDHRKRLWVARDRFGIKPLYMTQGPRSVAFGSEIKQLIGLPSVPGRMNLARVSDFLAWGMSDHTAQTMFESVHQVRAGEMICVDAAEGSSLTVENHQWYEPPHRSVQVSANVAAADFHDLLNDAIRLHLRSDVPVGSCLSGGLDSSSIVCLMSQEMGSARDNRPVRTISACYNEKSVDEKPYMDAVIARSHTEPHFVWPRADDVFQRASDITWHQDEPFGSTSIFAQWCVFEAAQRAGVKVMLDGQGADEQLAGYLTGFPFHLAGLVRRGDVVGLWRDVKARKRLTGTSITAQLQSIVPRLLPSPFLNTLYRRRQALLQDNWLGQGALQQYAGAGSAFETAIASRQLSPAHDLASLCVVMTFASNLQMLLHWEDRSSMAHSIEARVPFLDHPLVEFSLALGNAHKMVDGQTKHVLRQAVSGIIPDCVRNRHDKLGFATPETFWFRGPLRRPVEDGIERTLQLFPDLFNVEGVRKRSWRMLNGERPVDFWLWRMVNLGIWADRFKVSA